MISSKQKVDTSKSLYWQLFRPIFAIFFLYLLGDVFYRWDGFRYYASFSEYIANVSLTTLIWFTISALATLIVYVPVKSIDWCCRYMRINSLPLQIFIYTFILIATITLSIKTLFWQQLQVSFIEKLLVLLLIGFTAFIVTLFFRNRPGILNERITPLVGLFGIWVLLSVPIVVYQMFGSQEAIIDIPENTQSFVEDKSLPNIILVTFDSLRTRDMSVYGYNRPTTPFINKWAKSASIFSKLEAESTYTTPTVSSLMTGKRLWTHQTFHNSGSKPVRHYDESLPSLLKSNGYYTAAFVGAEPATANQLGIDHDFDFSPYASDFISPRSLLGHINKLLFQLFPDKFRMYDWIIKKDFVFNRVMVYFSQKVKKTESPLHFVFNRFFLHFDDQLEEPFFAWIHLHPPHDPYLPPKPFMGMFDTSLELRTKESQGELVGGSGRMSVSEATQATVDTLRARYDEDIRYCDNQFEIFIKGLSARNLLNNTIVILSSDHGESFEHNILAHGCLELFEEVTNIPLIIKVPGETETTIIDNVVEQIDVPATILDFAGIPVPSWMEGRSLKPLMYGENLIPKPAFSMALFNNKISQQISKGTISVWVADYKLIHSLDKNKSLLFNLRDDPYELNDLINKEPELGKHLLSLIQDNLKKANKIIAEGE